MFVKIFVRYEHVDGKEVSFSHELFASSYIFVTW